MAQPCGVWSTIHGNHLTVHLPPASILQRWFNQMSAKVWMEHSTLMTCIEYNRNHDGRPGFPEYSFMSRRQGHGKDGKGKTGQMYQPSAAERFYQGNCCQLFLVLSLSITIGGCYINLPACCIALGLLDDGHISSALRNALQALMSIVSYSNISWRSPNPRGIWQKCCQDICEDELTDWRTGLFPILLKTMGTAACVEWLWH